MMNIDKEVDELSKLDFKFKFYTKAGIQIGTTELINSILRNRYRFTREGGLDPISLFISQNDEAIISIQLTEFTPCCGKVIGRRLLVRSSYQNRAGLVNISENNIILGFKLLFTILDKVIENAMYTSITIIVSKTEQRLFNDLISTQVEGWKVINEFKNERMSTKNHCIEYCKNYFGN